MYQPPKNICCTNIFMPIPTRTRPPILSAYVLKNGPIFLPIIRPAYERIKATIPITEQANTMFILPIKAKVINTCCNSKHSHILYF